LFTLAKFKKNLEKCHSIVIDSSGSSSVWIAHNFIALLLLHMQGTHRTHHYPALPPQLQGHLGCFISGINKWSPIGISRVFFFFFNFCLRQWYCKRAHRNGRRRGREQDESEG
jgi:hypothetical protein